MNRGCRLHSGSPRLTLSLCRCPLLPPAPSPSTATHSPARYHGKIAFGEALRSNAEVSATFGVTTYPTLLVLCGGSRDAVIAYDGAPSLPPSVPAPLSLCLCLPISSLRCAALRAAGRPARACHVVRCTAAAPPHPQRSPASLARTPPLACSPGAGEMKSTRIARFLNQFYSPKACAAAIKIGAPALHTCCPCRRCCRRRCGSAELSSIYSKHQLGHNALRLSATVAPPAVQMLQPTCQRCAWRS